MMNPKEVHDKLEALEARMRQLSSTNQQLIDALEFAYAKLGEAMEYDSVIADRSDLDLVKTALRDAVEES